MGAKTKTGAAAGGALLLAIGLIAAFEGTKKTAYMDPAGIPTICTGHTGAEVKVGQIATDDMCRDLLEHDTAWAFAAEEKTLDHPESLDPWTRAAMASFIYNLGVGAWTSSPMPGLLNLGKVTAACNALLPYNMAPATDPVTGKVLTDPKTGKKVLKFYPGLARRREAERHLCLGEAW